MTNLLTALPEFDIRPFSHLLPSLERALISTADLLTLDASDIAKRALVPPGDVKKLADAVLDGLRAGLPEAAKRDGDYSSIPNVVNVKPGRTISTLDDTLDKALDGGILTGYLTEIVGESAVGKTQFLLTLLLSVQLASREHAGKSALYISTEAPLQTTRLAQILETHPRFSTLPVNERPSLSRIHSTHIHDVEAQEHILRFQVPVAIKKQNIGLLVIDSIAANYRAEFDKIKARNGAESFAKRSNQLSQLGNLLRTIARTNDVAVVVANQVADRFATAEQIIQSTHASQTTHPSRPNSPNQQLNAHPGALSSIVPPDSQGSLQTLSTDDPLALDHQQRFFTGWGDDGAVTNLKTPSLGLTWTNQLSARIALVKQPVYTDETTQLREDRDIARWKRTAKVVFSSWCAESQTDFEIWEGGVRAVSG